MTAKALTLVCSVGITLTLPVNDARAVTLIVPDEYPSLEAAVGASAAGDTVIVRCGTYREPTLSIPVPITIVGDPGEECVVIAGSSRPLVVVASINGEVRFENIQFDGEAYGGVWTEGINLSGSQVSFSDCRFQDFRNPSAIVASNSVVEFVGCDFQRNMNTPGGSVARMTGCSVRFASCSFRDNASSDFYSIDGGAVYLVNAGASNAPMFYECVFENNTSTGGGAAIYASGLDEVTIDGCDFFGNRSGDAGGALNLDRATITNSRFVHNVSTGCDQGSSNTTGRGGAILVSDGTISHCVFMENIAKPQCEDSGGHGGAIAGWRTQVSQSTFYRNRGRYGSAIWGSDVQVSRCIVAMSIGSPPLELWNDSRVQLSDIYGNWGGDPLGDPADNNFSAEPGFCGIPEANLALCASSPCAPGNLPNGEDGYVGAFGVGCIDCGSVPTLVTRFDYRVDENVVTFEWSLAVPREQRLERLGLSGGFGVEIEQSSSASYRAQDKPSTTGTFTYVLSIKSDEIWQEVHRQVVTLEAGLATSIGAVSPNPFLSGVRIQYSTGRPSQVVLEVTDLAGRRVTTLRREHSAPGHHVSHWNGRDERGHSVAAGTYLITLTGGRNQANPEAGSSSLDAPCS